MVYFQLTQEQRYQIGACLEIGMKKIEIARKIGVSRATVWREITRNRIFKSRKPQGYNPSHAIWLAKERHRRKRKRGISSEIWLRIEGLLRRYRWSPEQITERLRLEGLPTVSHETIYQHIYEDKRKGGDLYKFLRRRIHGYRKRIHKYRPRKGWDTRRPISERPAVVDERSRLGDWEADTIIGRERNGGILSLVERRSRYCLLKKVETKSAETVAKAVCELLSPVKDKVLTITSDNGVEFMRHETIATTLGADFFFADPYASWQRGTNENTNGLVRQYFPKKTDFTNLSDEDVQQVADRLNNRPRKVLNFRTPYEALNNCFVALIS